MHKRFFCFVISLLMLCQCFVCLGAQTNDAVQIDGSTEIPAINYYSSSDESAVNETACWIIGEEKVLIMRGDYGTDRSASYRIDVQNEGTYEFALRTSSWRNGINDNPELTLSVDGSRVGKIMVPYHKEQVLASKLIAPVKLGTYNLKSGEHTVTISTNWGSDTFIQSIVLSKYGINLEKEKSVYCDDEFSLTYEIVPSTLQITDLVWKSENPEICSVENGIITALKEGTAVIRLYSESQPDISASCTVTVIKRTIGEPYDNTPFEIFGGSSSNILYLAKKNKNAIGAGGTVHDYMGGQDTIETNLENMAVNGKNVGEYWYYTIDVKDSGIYKLDILGTSGWMLDPASTDGGARFELSIGDVKAADDTFILPAGSEPPYAWYQFTDSKKVSLGEFYLEKGVKNIKLVIKKLPNAGDIAFRKLWFTFVPTITDIQVENQNISIGVGKAHVLEYTLLPENVLRTDLAWESSDNTVCTVSDGVVTGVSKGTAVVTLKDNISGKEISWNVTVEVFPEKIVISKSNASLKVGQAVTLTAEVFPENADDKTVIWQSSNKEVASVKDGVVTANAAGTAVITALCGNVSAAATVTVSAEAQSSGGSSGGGGSKYIPSVYSSAQSSAESTFESNDGSIEKLDSAEMKKLFDKYDEIKYNINSESFSAVINTEFFTKYPSSKSLIYSLNGVDVIIGADALNKLNPKANSEALIKIDYVSNAIKLDLSLDGKTADDFNNAVIVKIKSGIYDGCTLDYNGENINYDFEAGVLSFEALGSGEYKIIFSKDEYSDIKKTEWARAEIQKAVKNGWLEPISSYEFGAEHEVTRGEFLGSAVKALKLSSDVTEVFDDVTPSCKFYNEISAAKALKIVNGTDGRNFLPDYHITRQDMAVILFNALNIDESNAYDEGFKFSDDEEIDDYAKEAVYALSAAGIIKGTGEGFSPKNNTTRAETAVLLDRISK